MTRYWISWYSQAEPESVPFNAWETGFRMSDDAATICAVIDAESEEAAFNIAREYYPDLEERFCKPQANDFQPGERFQE